ncbi:MAG: M67 family metallopeptidase [Chloroflexi bacterium]|nr:M67 family metallopeptidase [Chloroflexota bacterium]MCH8974599.1 M67 family metallopeptidase [Chloroflexota bacterium]
MVAHAIEEDPNECCGLLSGKDGKLTGHYRMRNAEQSPYRYSMDGKELLMTLREIEDGGAELQVIYHSHTHSPAYPSATDVRLATWPDASYLLVSLENRDDPDIRVFRIVDGEVTEEPVAIV